MTDPESLAQGDKQEQEKWYERTRYQILLFAVGIALFDLVLVLILDWYIAPQTTSQKKDLVQALGLITAGLAGAVGIYFTWRGQRLARKAQEATQRNTVKQLKQSRNELEITRRGQITERFTQAIDQLGSENPEIRLGGIYSLERTAREDRDYHWPIMEVLSTYVRQHAPRKPEQESDKRDIFAKPDIQGILTVIGRRSAYYRDVEHGVINLRYADLSRVDLSGANLEGVDLWRANLSGANLQKTNLQKANLQEANLQGASLSGADLREANVWGANLERTRFMQAKLQKANLSGILVLTQLQGANLQGANLEGAKFKSQIEVDELKRAIGDETTKLPDYIRRPETWSKSYEEQIETIRE